MTERPTPRRSALAGTSPVTPAMTGKTGLPSVPSPTDATSKITVQLDADLIGRARNAYWSTGHITRTRSFAAWVGQAIQSKLEADQDEYNGGEPFDPIEAGEIPTGRRS